MFRPTKQVVAANVAILADYLGEFTPSYQEDGKPCIVYKNPSRKEYNEVYDDDNLRAFLTDKDILVWDTYRAIHYSVREHFKLNKKVIPLIIYGRMGQEVEVVVTDNTKDTPWWHSPKVGEAVKNHPWMRRNFKSVSVSYYDEDVVGDWSELDG